MSYSITTANSDLSAVLHGTTLNKIANLNGLHNRTARQLLLDVDPIETVRKTLTTTPLYNQVWDYACPTDLKGNRIIDISPPYIRDPGQIIGQTYNQPFDIAKNQSDIASLFTIQWNNQVKTIRINDTTLPQGITLDTCETTTGWVAAGTASNLTEDNVNYASGSGSLSFDISGPTLATLTKTLSSSLDMSTQLNQASIFFYVYYPSGANAGSLSIRWGSDISNYYQSNITTTNEGNALATGWNLVRADWSTATVVGTPVSTAIAYIRVAFLLGAAQTGVKIDNIISNMGLYRQLEYYSKFLFRSATTGAFQETVTDNSNLINLDTDSYNLYFNLLAFYATQQIQGVSALFFDDNFFGQEYQKGKTRYTGMVKSQVQKPGETYYNQQKGGYGKFLGRRWGL